MEDWFVSLQVLSLDVVGVYDGGQGHCWNAIVFCLDQHTCREPSKDVQNASGLMAC